ncbi:MAG: ParB/RepB/Spo0J family partition protein [Elusimicrobia bacterium]|nr:ParB/RepB/Spo0J family partition protein [Elusimicrobiota bacterium]
MKKVLGRGLESLIPQTGAGKYPSEAVMSISVNKIKPNRYQPRKKFDSEKLAELADSIKTHGLAQPVLVTPSIAPGEYELVAGERRFRATKLAGFKEIKAIVKKEYGDKEKFNIALIENVQRENLDPIEQAKAFKRLADEFSHTQEEIAAIIGKDRSVVANTIRLLTLPENVQEMISAGRLTLGHGKILAGITDNEELEKLVEIILSESLNVREIEARARQSKQNAKKPKKIKTPEIEISNLTEELQRKLGAKVNISGSSKKGKIEISYYNMEDLERLANLLRTIC